MSDEFPSCRQYRTEGRNQGLVLRPDRIAEEYLRADEHLRERYSRYFEDYAPRTAKRGRYRRALVGAQHLGFVYEAGVFANDLSK